LLAGAREAAAQDVEGPRASSDPESGPRVAWSAAPGAAEAPALEARDSSPDDAGRAGARAPRRRQGTGSERIDAELRRRLDDEERRLREIFEATNERELLRLFRECAELPADEIRLGPDDLLTPSAAFLRAVSPRTQDHAPLAREGVHAWAAREARRAWRREYARDLELRRTERESRFALLELWEESDRLYRVIDESAAAFWSRDFPEYWGAHPAARPCPPRREGERIEIARLGPITLDNELSLRCDVRTLLGGATGDRDADERRARSSRRAVPRAQERLFEVGERAELGLFQRGNLYGGEVLSVDARIHASTGLGAYETGFVRMVRGDLEWSFHAREDGRRLVSIELEGFYEPADDGCGVAVVLELVRF
jgi:hypothetical protein